MKQTLIHIVALTIPVFILAQDICDWNKAHANFLRGVQGRSTSDFYWFEHLSGVERHGNVNGLNFGIKNLQPERVLTANWVRGDGKTQLFVSQLAPGGCDSNYTETLNNFSEDGNAVIKYGPNEDQTKVDASLYVKTPGGTQQPSGAGPKLKSCIKADIKGRDGHTKRIHLEFGTGFEGSRFEYTVINQGSDTAVFRIPEFSQTWSKVLQTPGSRVVSQWKTAGDQFTADASPEPAKYIMQSESLHRGREVQSPIQVTSRSGEVLAAGQVTIYLPVTEPRE